MSAAYFVARAIVTDAMNLNAQFSGSSCRHRDTSAASLD